MPGAGRFTAGRAPAFIAALVAAIASLGPCPASVAADSLSDTAC